MKIDSRAKLTGNPFSPNAVPFHWLNAATILLLPWY
jgi:hypothetical protein